MLPSVSWQKINVLVDHETGDVYDFKFKIMTSWKKVVYNLVFDDKDNEWCTFTEDACFEIWHPVPSRVQEAYTLGILMGDVDENIL